MTVNFNPVARNPNGRYLIWLTHCLIMTMLLSTFTPASKSQAQTLENPDFAAAMQQITNQNWQQAEALLTAILQQNPARHRARLELGRVFIKLGKTEQAKSQFNTVLKHPTVPDRVKQNIKQLLQQIPVATAKHMATQELEISTPQNQASSEKHRFNAVFQFSLGYDDNVRYSAADYFIEDDPFLNGVFVDFDDGSFVFVAPDGFVYDEEGNLLFENDGFLDLGDPDRENGFAEARLEFNHSYAFAGVQGLIWNNQFSLQTTKNEQLSRYDRLQARLETGLSWRLSEQWKLNVDVHYRRLERDGAVQVRAFGLAPELTWYNHFGSWSFGLQWLRRQYEDSLYITGELETLYEGFDNNITGLSTKWSNLFLDNKLLLLAKFEYSDSNASDDFDYKGQRYTLASVYKINDSLTFLLSADDFHQDYSESVGGPLDDDITTFRSRLTWQFNDTTQLFLAGERAIRTSDIYGGLKSDKSLVQAGVEFSF